MKAKPVSAGMSDKHAKALEAARRIKDRCERLLSDVAFSNERELVAIGDALLVARALLDAGWQPIESAPRNATRILLGKGTTTTEGVFLHDPDGWMTFSAGNVSRDWPTHWMPLPSPPESACGHPAEPLPSPVSRND